KILEMAVARISVGIRSPGIECFVSGPGRRLRLMLCSPYFPKTLLLFIPSILFTVVHFVFIPQPTDAYYTMHFDSGIFNTFWSYWAYTLGSLRPEKSDWRPLWL